MKLASFVVNSRESYGLVEDNALTEPEESFLARFPTLRSVITADKLRELNASRGMTHALDSIGFLTPIPHPDKIICVGVNYRPHIEEMGREVPDHPVVFVRFPGSLTAHERPIIRPKASSQLDFEGELAVVVGRPARHVSRTDALDYVAGYCCFMDGSVRDWQRHTMQFTPGKNFVNSGSAGPWLVTTDDIPDPTVLTLSTRVNGTEMQKGRVADLVFDIPSLIAYCSTFAELLPGDIIATGTPGGVGAARTPPQWLVAGDRVEVEVPGVGLLTNTVLDE